MSYNITLYIKGLIDWHARERYVIVLRRGGKRSRPTDLKTAVDAARGLLQRGKKCHIEDIATIEQVTFPAQLNLIPEDIPPGLKLVKRKKRNHNVY